MIDLKTRKTFLRKIETKEVSSKDLYVGNRVMLFSRSLEIIDFGDDVTKEAVLPQRESCLVLIQDVQLIQEIQQAGLSLGRLKKVLLLESQARKLGRGDTGMVEWATAAPTVGIEVVGKAVLSRSMDLLRQGSTVLGYVSLSGEDACEDLKFFFSPSLPPLSSSFSPSLSPLTLDAVTCCIVLPHANHIAGDILSATRSG